MAKVLTYGNECRSALLAGVDYISDAVKVTLGCKGRNVAIGRRLIGLTPIVTKDGWTVANSLDPPDPRHQVGADLCREAANKCVRATADGTTTATVLTQAMCHAGARMIENGLDPWSLRRAMEHACALVLEQVGMLSRPCAQSDTRSIALISSNYDCEIADMVSHAFEKVGVEGAVQVDESGTALTSIEVSKGIRFNSGDFLSPTFVTDPERFEATWDDCRILLFEGRIATARSLMPILKEAASAKVPLLIIAGDWEQDALACLVVNRLRAQAPIVGVKTGAYAGRRTDLLRDLAVVTGGTAILDSDGTKIENVRLEACGCAGRIVVTDKDTTITGGRGSAESLESMVGEIRQRLANAEGNDKLWLERRLAQLTGGVALVKVGGNTEAEMRERKDRFDDAVGATRSAIAGGYVAGGGLALLKAQARVRGDFRGDALAGLTVVSQACAEPLKQIAKNAGKDQGAILSKTMGHPAFLMPRDSFGYDAKADEFHDLVDAGVMDPTRVVTEALRNATATASLLLTTEVLDTEPQAEIDAAIEAARRLR